MLWLLALTPATTALADEQADNGKAVFQLILCASNGRNYIDTSTGASQQNWDVPAGTTEFHDFREINFTLKSGGIIPCAITSYRRHCAK